MLVQLNNFTGAMAIVAAFENAAILRLKKTFAKLPRTAAKVMSSTAGLHHGPVSDEVDEYHSVLTWDMIAIRRFEATNVLRQEF